MSHFLPLVFIRAKMHRRYLVGAVGVADPREGLQGRGDGVGQDEGPRRWSVLLHLTHTHTPVNTEDTVMTARTMRTSLTTSDSRQETS